MLSNRLPTKHLAIRLLGVGVSDFDNPDQTQRSLFDDEDRVAQVNLDQAADEICEKFGSILIGRASGLLHHAKHTPRPKPGDQPPIRPSEPK